MAGATCWSLETKTRAPTHQSSWWIQPQEDMNWPKLNFNFLLDFQFAVALRNGCSLPLPLLNYHTIHGCTYLSFDQWEFNVSIFQPLFEYGDNFDICKRTPPLLLSRFCSERHHIKICSSRVSSIRLANLKVSTGPICLTQTIRCQVHKSHQLSQVRLTNVFDLHWYGIDWKVSSSVESIKGGSSNISLWWYYWEGVKT